VAGGRHEGAADPFSASSLSPGKDAPLTTPEATPFRAGGAEATPFVERPFPGEDEGGGGAAARGSPRRRGAPSPAADRAELGSGLDLFGSNDAWVGSMAARARAGGGGGGGASTATPAPPRAAPASAAPRSGEVGRLRRENDELKAELAAVKARAAAAEAALSRARRPPSAAG